MNNVTIATLTLFVTLAGTSLSHAKDTPYYASIKVDTANVRTGPSIKYPIQWVYKRKSWPVKITATFEGWRKISDLYGEAGWIHERLLSDHHKVVINSNGTKEMHRLPLDHSAITQMVENGVVGNLIKCQKSWCQIEVASHSGWIKSKYLWGTSNH